MEALLTSLLATEEPSSWKVDGESGNVLVLLRFKQRDGPPLPTKNYRGSCRKRTPAQRRRDQLRAEKHRQRGEKRRFDTSQSSKPVDSDVANRSILGPDTARNSRPPVVSDHVTQSALTSDPLSSDQTQTSTAASLIPSMSRSTIKESQNDVQKEMDSSSGEEITVEDVLRIWKKNRERRQTARNRGTSF